MCLKFKNLLVVVLVVQAAFSQTNDVLLSVDGDEVTASEFIRVYNKNLDLVTDDSQKNVDGYLNLFIDYQLKLKEAKRLKLHEETKYLNEFTKYKRQLSQKYLNDNKVTEQLINEAYERGTYDIKVRHALVRLDENTNDTINAYNKISKLREAILKDGYDNAKEKMHNGKTVFLENLGYISVFRTVYDFESAAFNSPVGEVSMPFRTQFGYHIVNVEEKIPTKGYITTAHIMVAHKQKDSTVNSEQRIKEIYKKLQQGEDFESLVKQFSDDKSTISQGGKFTPFRRGQLNADNFESAAFALKADGDLSEPIKTKYGWHIIKRLDLAPIKALKDMKPELERLVKKDSRSKLINEAMVSKLKKAYNISFNESAKPYFTSILDKTYFLSTWQKPETFKKDDIIFTINTKNFTYGEFLRHLQAAANRFYRGKDIPLTAVVNKEFDRFFETSILQYRKDNLENENQEYATILNEYRDGLLLFDLMEKEIWNKASKDSVGLQTFYETNKANYIWDKRIDVVIASSADKSTTKAALKMMKKKSDIDAIGNALNTADKQNIIFTKGTFNLTDSKLPANLNVKKSLSKIYKHNDAFHVISIRDILPSKQKTLKEARGTILADYQNEIETSWLKELRTKFKVDVNQDVLAKVKQQLNNK